MQIRKRLKRLKVRKINFKKIPEAPGVYIFWQGSTPIYIGKAINLKNRLRSYFVVNLTSKTKRMMTDALEFSFIRVNSELESLLLEARLIRKYQPRYNSAAKDDKHPLYIRITKESYAKVVTARKIEGRQTNLAFFGPFPSSKNVSSVLQTLRKIFPYSEHKVAKRPCLYSHIGLCSPCPSFIERLKDENKKEELTRIYKKNISHIGAVLSGKFKSVRNDLFDEMILKSKNEEFEEAQGLKEQISRLDYITQTAVPTESFLQNPNLFEDIRRGELAELASILNKFIPLKSKLSRIECFDISHLGGNNPSASMVTFINGEADKNLYRHFRIRQEKSADDISSLKEVAKRRSKYFASWGTPDLILVDGGKPQVSALYGVLGERGVPIIGIAKRYETLVIARVESAKLKLLEKRLEKGGALNLIQRIRDESHRFARRYHHHLVKKSLLAYT